MKIIGLDIRVEKLNSFNKGFEAGQQSRQAEVDELQKKYEAMYQAFTVADDCRKEWHRCYVGVRKNEDELQKRIDKALSEIEGGINGRNHIEYITGLLKGKSE